jgi:hypothetical protein
VSGGDCQLAALGEDAIGDGELAACRARGGREGTHLRIEVIEPFQGLSFVAVDPRQLALADAALQLLRPLALSVKALNPELRRLDPFAQVP